MERIRYNEYLGPEFSAVVDYKVRDTFSFHLRCELNMLWAHITDWTHELKGDQIL